MNAAANDRVTEGCVVRSLELYPLNRRGLNTCNSTAAVVEEHRVKRSHRRTRTQTTVSLPFTRTASPTGADTTADQHPVLQRLPDISVSLLPDPPFVIDQVARLRELDRRVASIVSQRLRTACLERLQSRQEEQARATLVKQRQLFASNKVVMSSNATADPLAVPGVSAIPGPDASHDQQYCSHSANRLIEGTPRWGTLPCGDAARAETVSQPARSVDGVCGGRGAGVDRGDVLASLALQAASQPAGSSNLLSSRGVCPLAERTGVVSAVLPFNTVSSSAETMRHFDDKSRAMGSFIQNVARTVARAGAKDAPESKNMDKGGGGSGGAQHEAAQEGVELVRVMRLKGLAKYNRGLFAGLHTPPSDYLNGGFVYMRDGALRASAGRHARTHEHVRTTAWYLRHQDPAVVMPGNEVTDRQPVVQGASAPHHSEADLVLAEIADASCPRALRSFDADGMSFFQWCDAATPVRVPRSRFKLDTPRGSEDESVVQAVTRVIQERYRKTLSAEERAEARRRVKQHRLRAKIKTEAELAAQMRLSKDGQSSHHPPFLRREQGDAVSEVEGGPVNHDAAGTCAGLGSTHNATFVDVDEQGGVVCGRAREVAHDAFGHLVTPQSSSSFFESSSRSLIPFARKQSVVSEESQLPLVEHTMPGDTFVSSEHDDNGSALHPSQRSTPPLSRAGGTVGHRAERWHRGHALPSTTPTSASHERVGVKAEPRDRSDHRLHASSEFADSVSHRQLSITAHPLDNTTISSTTHTTHDGHSREIDVDARVDARSGAAEAITEARSKAPHDAATAETGGDETIPTKATVPLAGHRAVDDEAGVRMTDTLTATAGSSPASGRDDRDDEATTPFADEIEGRDEHELLLASFAERQAQLQQGSARPRTGGAKSVLQDIAAALEDSGRVSDLLDDSRDGLHRHALFTPRAMFSGHLSELGLEDAGRTISQAEDDVDGGTADETGRRRRKSREEVVTGFVLSDTALREKFRREAEEANSALLTERDALRAEVEAQRALLVAFGSDVRHLSRGVKGKLSADAFAVALTQEVNAYAQRTGLEWARLVTPSDALTVEAASEAYLRHFSRGQVTTREAACQVTEEDLGCVDTTVRETEAAMEDLFSHEKGLLQSIKLATIAVANIMSFHSSLEVEATCKECFCILEQPRTLWPCGHTFCQRCLAEMYNAEEELVCAECHSLCEVGYTPNWSVEMMANYQVVRQDPNDADPFAAPSTQLGGRVQTIEGVLRRLLQELVAVQTHFYSEMT